MALKSITRFDGTIVPIKFDAILDRIEKASEGLNEISPAQVTQKVIAGMVDGISTTELDYLTAETAAHLVSQNPEYDTLATRVFVSRMHKKNPLGFTAMMETLYTDKILSDEFIENVRKLDLEDDVLDRNKDYDFSYFGISTLARGSYLLSTLDKRFQELPCHMYMRVAVGMYKTNKTKVLKAYNQMADHLYTHASPTIFNSGTRIGSLISCFLLTTDDDIKQIASCIKRCMLISKGMGGIGVSLQACRGKHAIIKSTGGIANGILPWMSIFEEVAKAVNQGGKRKGSIAIYLEPWHVDIEEFLEVRLKNTKEELSMPTLFIGLWMNDLFMKRLEADQDWSLMSPDECPGLVDSFGQEFEKLYTKYENEGRAKKTVKAMHIWKKVLKSLIETGMPYIVNKDAANLKNAQSNRGTLRGSNLCVTGETRILTREYGYVPIVSVENKPVQVWNGEQWSLVTPRFIADAPIVHVKLNNGTVIDCTYDHGWFIENGLEETRVQAQELKPGAMPIKYALPIRAPIHFDSLNDVHDAFYLGIRSSMRDRQQWWSTKGDQYNELCMNDKFLSKKIVSENCTGAFKSHIVKGFAQNVHELLIKLFGAKMRKNIGGTFRFAVKLPEEIPISLPNSLAFLQGYCFGDNVDYAYNINVLDPVCLVIRHSNDMISNLHFMLHVLGIQSLIKLNPDGSNSNMLIDTDNCQRLKTLGFEFSLIPGATKVFPELYNPQQYSAYIEQLFFALQIPDTIEVAEVRKGKTYVKTYCFKEPIKERGIFEGQLLSNCAEILEYNSNEEVACCNLASISLPAFYDPAINCIDYHALLLAAGDVVENLNAIIDTTVYPVKQSKISNMKMRPIAIGVQGLSDLFQMMGIAFESKEALKVDATIFESIYYGAVNRSIDLAIRDGAYECYPGSTWSEGKFQFDLWKEQGTEVELYYDWELLRDRVKKFGIRNSLLTSVMPTASTSQILNNTECIEPPVANVYARAVKTGEYMVFNKQLPKVLKEHGIANEKTYMTIKHHKGELTSDLNIPSNIMNCFKCRGQISQRSIIDHAAVRAPFIDQTQSMNLFFEQPDDKKITAALFYGWKKGLKTMCYYTRTAAATQAVTSEKSKSDAAEERRKAYLDYIKQNPDMESCVNCSA